MISQKAALATGSDEIQSLMRQSQDLLGAAPAAEPWLKYINHISGLVTTGLTEMLNKSLLYLHSQVMTNLHETDVLHC